MKLWLLSLSVFFAAMASPAKAADVDPLLPVESKMVFKLNMKQIIESDIIKKYALAQLKQAMEGQEAQKVLKELGLDPLKDIDTLSGGMWGEGQQDVHFLMVLRGKFNAEKLFAAIEKQVEKNGDKLSIVKDGDTKLVKIVVDRMPEPVYATMANDKTIVVGTEKKLVMDALKASDSNAKPALKAELVDLVKEADDKASLFFCGKSDGKVGDIPPNPFIEDVEKLKEQLGKIENYVMTLRVGTDVSIEFTMGMKDTDAAKDLGETLGGLLDKAKNMLPLLAGAQPQAKPIVNDLTKTLKSSVDKKYVKVNVKVTGDSIGKAVGVDE